MTRLWKHCAALLLALAASAAAAVPEEMVTVGDIDGESDAKMSVINVRLDKTPRWKKLVPIQDHGSFLQLVLPGALVPEPGKFYDGGNPHLPKVAVFQLTPSDAGVRFFASSDAAKVRKALSAELLGNRIVLRIDHAKLPGAKPVAAAAKAAPAKAEAAETPADKAAEAVVAAEEAAKAAEPQLETVIAMPAPAKPFVGPPTPPELAAASALSADDIIARTEVDRSVPAPSELVKQPGDGPKLATGGLDLREQLIKVAIFSGAMLLLMGLTYLARPYLRRRARTKHGEPEPALTMKTLASLPLAPRQKISVIQVGDERFLVSISPDAVNFLTALGKSTPTSALATAMPDFARALSSPAMDLRPAPTLKNIPGNDEDSLRESPRRAPVPQPKAAVRKTAEPAEAPKPAKRPGGRINVQISDDGVKELDAPPPRPRARQAAAEAPGESQAAIDDVTRMIREKLKTLRTI